MDFDVYSQSLMATRGQIRSTWGDERISSLVVLAQTDSTNRLGRYVLESFAELESRFRPFALVAWTQSAGRGRLGRSWASPPGLGAYVTVVVEVPEGLGLETLPALVGATLCRTLREGCDCDAIQLKWPNDVVAQGKKLAGILIETVALSERRRGAVIGFGINWHYRREELPVPTATSLRLVLEGEPPPMSEMVLRLVNAVVGEVARRPERAEVMEAYRSFLVHKVGDTLRYRVDDQDLEGEFLGLDDAGRLLLRRDDEDVRISAGEILAQANAHDGGSAERAAGERA